MEPVIYEKGNIRYDFYPDRLVITKKNKITHEIKYDEIKEISYNPERGLKDLVSMLLAPSLAHFHFKDAFIIELKKDAVSKSKIVGFPLPKDVFERIKGILGVPITLV